MPRGRPSTKRTTRTPPSRNERITENLVRDALREGGYYNDDADIRVEEQKSNIDLIRKLLKTASKSGMGGRGAPEFIITSPSNPDTVLLIECKSSNADHISAELKAALKHDTCPQLDVDPKRNQRFAADGVLCYASSLSKEYNVISVAYSGESKSGAKITTFLNPKGHGHPKFLLSKEGKQVNRIIPWNDYVDHATYDPTIKRLRYDELMAFSRELHDFMRDHAKLTESEKPLLVSGTLIALRSKAFAISFDEYDPEDLQKEWMRVIRAEIQKAEIPKAKKDSMAQPYSSIAVHPELSKSTKSYPRGVLHELITRLSKKVWPFISIYEDFDVVGQFYGEFLKYTGGDKKALGIVLTPRHITELFALLANVSKESKVLDICAGTGGFLISAMREMMRTALTEEEQARIKKHSLIGVEQQPNMFALAASNMILRGDGKANLHQGSCFDDAIIKAVSALRCDVGMLNPPFSQGDADLHELYFVKQMLDCLVKRGTGIAIVPMSCAISPHPARNELLRYHTLEAVMSMPLELFSPVGIVTCIMVFTAHVPHSSSNKKTWFGYWRNDGFVKTKHLGRVDLHNRWPAIRGRWVSSFRNRELIENESVAKAVTADDEWCAEAYMKTDYSTLTPDALNEEIKKYVVYRILHQDYRDDAEEDGETE